MKAKENCDHIAETIIIIRNKRVSKRRAIKHDYYRFYPFD